MVVVIDDEDRENEGDLTMAAEMITPEAINLMATHGRGLICLAMTGERIDELQLPQMALEGSALAGRRARDFARPGHVFPLCARAGGVLERRGQTEAAVDLASLAGLYPAGVICEILNDDGTMVRVPDLVRFCRKHALLMITVADLARRRFATDDDDSLATIDGRFSARCPARALRRSVSR